MVDIYDVFMCVGNMQARKLVKEKLVKKGLSRNLSIKETLVVCARLKADTNVGRCKRSRVSRHINFRGILEVLSYAGECPF